MLNLKRSLAATLYCVKSTLNAVSYTHLRAHETGRNLVCRLLLEKKKKKILCLKKKQQLARVEKMLWVNAYHNI